MRTLALLALVSLAGTQDVEYERALQRAQASKPQRLTSVARIAPENEPGTPLVIAGHVYRADGRTPAAGITVFAYHTDRTGVYDAPANGAHSWRLKGWAITDAAGRFEFRTIRPAPYPGRNVAAHVHLSLEGPSVARRSAGVLFAGDPLLTEAERAASRQAGAFGEVVPVVRRNGVEYVEIKLKL
jgi:protocatechuate 3,4-dioxygenase beta subunit